MKTIEEFRRNAKGDLCPTCFKKYKMFIEPNIRELLFKPIDDWRDVESNITQMVMVTERVCKPELIYLSFGESSDLFRWDKIKEGGRDNWKLIKFLKKKYCIDWVITAEIKKIEGKTIKLSTEKNSLSLILNEDETIVNLKIDDGTTDKFIVRKIKDAKGEKLIMYKEGKDKHFTDEEFKKLDRIKKMHFTEKIDTLYKNKILRDLSHRVLDEANEVRNKIHDPSIVAPFSEQDFKLFSFAKEVTDNLLQVTRIDYGKDIAKELTDWSENLKDSVEKRAEQCLLKLNLDD
ncbi:MAG: hypothetical protein WC556_14330 [Candidatus Methanoperedens sp.]